MCVWSLCCCWQYRGSVCLLAARGRVRAVTKPPPVRKLPSTRDTCDCVQPAFSAGFSGRSGVRSPPRGYPSHPPGPILPATVTPKWTRVAPQTSYFTPFVLPQTLTSAPQSTHLLFFPRLVWQGPLHLFLAGT